MEGDAPLPRRSLALLCGIHAAVFGWAAITLPWREASIFGALAAALAAVHGATSLLALTGRRELGAAWRILAFLSLLCFAWASWAVLSSATHLAVLYGGLGRGLGIALVLPLAAVALFTLPIAIWGVAATRTSRAFGAAASAGVALVAAGLAATALDARATPAPIPGADAAEVAEALDAALDLRAQTAPVTTIFGHGPAGCADPPEVALERGLATALVFRPGTHEMARTRGGRRGALPRFHALATCVQRPPADLAAGIAAVASDARLPLKIDVVASVRPLTPRDALTDALSLRPGLDGACAGVLCLAPWQLLASVPFDATTPLPFLENLRFGFSPDALREALGNRAEGVGIDGLTRIETLSFAIDSDGALRRLRRLHRTDVVFDDASLARAIAAAQEHVLSGQRGAGNFRYELAPFTGIHTHWLKNLPRQGGTALVLCELGDDTERVRDAADRALAKFDRWKREIGDAFALVRKKGVARAMLGETALPLAAYLGCRDRVGPRNDALIGRLGRFVLSLQRPDGSFYPAHMLQAGEPDAGPEFLYQSGQAVLALTLLEKLAAQPDAPDGLPPHDILRDAVERAMDHAAGDYWSHPLADFFFLEEGWHCQAARASLGHHRHDGYERFCLDYVSMKSRLILDETSGVDPDFVGGFGFGNLVVPHTTGTAGFGESLAAAMAIRRARGETRASDAALMRRVLGFLVRQQWDDSTCFACAPERLAVDGFSQSLAVPYQRVDYQQHAWGALGHGARELALVRAE